jgi:phosphohistidine phosphatase
MTTCYLARHGSAKSGVEDPRRPLTDAGRNQVETVARAVADRGVTVVEVWHSDKLRARQTAEILARLVSNSDSMRQVENLAPDDDPTLAQAAIEAGLDPVIVVGHLPHLSHLVSLLVTGDPERGRIEFRTAQIVCLSRRSGKWQVDWTMAPPD